MKPLGDVAGASLAERVQAAVEAAAQHAEAVDREGRFPIEAVEALRDNRLMGFAVPPELGGEGAGLADIAPICTTLGTACASTAMVFAMHHICLANLIDCGLESPWHRELMHRATTEQLLFASSTTEAGVGGDLRQSICAVEADGAAFNLAKAAPVISYGEETDAIFATARRDPDAPSSDQVLCVLLADQYELERVSTWDALGMRGTCSHGFRFKATAPIEQILPRPFADIAAESMIAGSHILWSSVWCGIAADAMAKAQAFVIAEARKSPGSPPASATKLAEAYARFRTIEATIADALARWAAMRAAPERAATVGFSLAMNALKVSVSTTALQVVEDALMICGLQGYKNSGPYGLGRPLRDIHSARLMISNDRIMAGAGQMMLIQRPAAARRA
ncbi:acyl-CoA dehydrogenase family protein [Phenylobacterium sp.]|uniref:acyl-CoA dehydrogenase family protein n=1 Tax=Phenylobacterium sp. TaxID=1871053 RepID=UPI002DE89C6D|nr:acyl-CoA dehydrogenase family protein [Phenylobacterium sp.]